MQARPVGRVERAVKWVRRHPAVAALLAAVLLVDGAGRGGRRVEVPRRGTAEGHRREAEAQHEADKAKKARDFLVSIFELSDANGQRGTMTARQILDDAEKRIPKEFADQPELQAELLAAIETVYAKMTANAPLAMILEVSGTVQLQSTRDAKPAGGSPGAALCRRPPEPGGRRPGATRGPVRPAQGTAPTGNGGDDPPQRLRTGRRGPRAGPGHPDDLRASAEGDVLHGLGRRPKKGVKTEIKEDFEIAVHDVTQGQWQAVMGNNPSYFSRFGGRSE